MKHCNGCNQTKALTEFSKDSEKRDGLQTRCKVCQKAYNKKWQQSNPEKVNAKARKWAQNNREKKNASQRKRNKRPEYKKKRRARENKQYHTDPLYRIKKILRARLRHALKGKNKSAKTMTLLGCSYTHAKDHLEKQFLPGMTWENQGKWHIDHMMPCASFDLSDPEQQRRCCHYTNLQPMWGTENISKGDNILYNRVWNGCRWINND